MHQFKKVFKVTCTGQKKQQSKYLFLIMILDSQITRIQIFRIPVNSTQEIQENCVLLKRQLEGRRAN